MDLIGKKSNICSYSGQGNTKTCNFLNHACTHFCMLLNSNKKLIYIWSSECQFYLAAYHYIKDREYLYYSKTKDPYFSIMVYRILHSKMFRLHKEEKSPWLLKSYTDRLVITFVSLTVGSLLTWTDGRGESKDMFLWVFKNSRHN